MAFRLKHVGRVGLVVVALVSLVGVVSVAFRLPAHGVQWPVSPSSSLSALSLDGGAVSADATWAREDPRTLNLVANPSFERLTRDTAIPHLDDEHYEDRTFFGCWEPFLDPYFVDAEVARTGATSLRVESSVTSDKYIVGQHIVVSPDLAQRRRLTLSVWHMARAVRGAAGDGFAVLVDVAFRNGTRSYGNTVRLQGGTHGWERACQSWPLQPEAAPAATAAAGVSALTVFIVWSEHVGYAWIDDVRLALDNDVDPGERGADGLAACTAALDLERAANAGARGWFAAGSPARDSPPTLPSSASTRSASPAALPTLARAVSHGCCRKRTQLAAEEQGLGPDDVVSLVTQLTVDRLPALARMADAWQGPISAAVYVFSDADVAALARARDTEFPALRRFVDFHTLQADAGRWSFQNLGLYPVNSLRNAAMDGARTRYGVLLDVDFVVSMTAAEFGPLFARSRRLAVAGSNEPGSGGGGGGGGTVFVLPAFELVPAAEQLAGTFEMFEPAAVARVDARMRSLAGALPQTRALVQDRVRAGEMRQVHEDKYEVAHAATDYERWFKADEGYRIQYQFEFEPYVAVDLDAVPRFDERFVGYGFDKVIHSAALFYAGFRFHVLPHVFVTHVDHGVPSWREKSPMLRVRVHEHYFSFLEELRVKFEPQKFVQSRQQCF